MTDRSTHGKICYLILPTTDPARAAAFYRDVFNWAIRTHDDGAYAFDDPTGAVSGMWTTERAPVDGGYEVDIMVDDVAATAARILEQGGTILETPQKLSESETYAVFRDPDGNRLGLYNHGSQEVS
jgi:hypothetical protein